MTAVREHANASRNVFDDDDILLPLAEHAPLRRAATARRARARLGRVRQCRGACRACCARTSTPPGSRPGWLLHDSALPGAIRLLGRRPARHRRVRSDRLRWVREPAEDLRRMVETLAVGRVAIVGIGQGADDAFAFAARYPALVASVSARLGAAAARARRRGRRVLRSLRGRRDRRPGTGPLSSWIRTAGKDADLTQELTWARMLRRLDVISAQVLGDRWKESDFREAVAADAAQINGAWTEPARAGGPTAVGARPGVGPVPVRALARQARDRHDAAGACSRSPGSARCGRCTRPAGSSAILGAGTAILDNAAHTFPGRAGRLSRPAGLSPIAGRMHRSAASTGGNCRVADQFGVPAGRVLDRALEVS